MCNFPDCRVHLPLFRCAAWRQVGCLLNNCLHLLYSRLPELLNDLHDRCDGSLGLFNHNGVTAVVGKDLLAVSR